jgi:hypothetical protein
MKITALSGSDFDGIQHSQFMVIGKNPNAASFDGRPDTIALGLQAEFLPCVRGM